MNKPKPKPKAKTAPKPQSAVDKAQEVAEALECEEAEVA
jgi:hypothetical protein